MRPISITMTNEVVGFEHLQDAYENELWSSLQVLQWINNRGQRYVLMLYDARWFLFCKKHLYIPKGTMSENFIHEVHAGGIFGHFGRGKS